METTRKGVHYCVCARVWGRCAVNLTSVGSSHPVSSQARSNSGARPIDANPPAIARGRCWSVHARARRHDTQDDGQEESATQARAWSTARRLRRRLTRRLTRLLLRRLRRRLRRRRLLLLRQLQRKSSTVMLYPI